MTTKVRNKGAQRAILKRLLQLHVDHSTIVDGLSLADVSTTLNLSRAETEALVETLVSEGYLYSTHDTDVTSPKKFIICLVSDCRGPLPSLSLSRSRHNWSAVAVPPCAA